MTLLGLCLALYVALAFASVNLQFTEITLKGLPVIFIAVVYGPIEAMLVGAIGEFIHQLGTYGITPTTALWILPPVVRGLIVGLLFKQKDVKKYIPLWIFTVVLCCIVVTAINTFVIWLDAKLFEYSSGLTTIRIVFRFVGSIVTAVVYGLVVPFLFEPLIKQGKFETETPKEKGTN